MVMAVSGSVTTSFPPPVIHDSGGFLLCPRFMFTPSYVFTPSITSHFSSRHSLPPAASADSWRGVGILTDRRSAPSHPPRQSLIFEEPNPPEGLQNSSLFYYSRALRIRVLEVCSGVGEVADVHLLPWITSSTWGSENNPNTKRNVGKEINNQVRSAF